MCVILVKSAWWCQQDWKIGGRYQRNTYKSKTNWQQHGKKRKTTKRRTTVYKLNIEGKRLRNTNTTKRKKISVDPKGNMDSLFPFSILFSTSFTCYVGRGRFENQDHKTHVSSKRYILSHNHVWAICILQQLQYRKIYEREASGLYFGIYTQNYSFFTRVIIPLEILDLSNFFMF